MSTHRHLTDSQRAFFTLVSQAAFSNPFSEKRLEADIKISGAPPGTAPEQRLALVMKEVSAHVAELEAKGKADIRLYGSEEREVLLIALLFDAFHRFIDEIDRHIEGQLKAGEEPVRVAFARELLELLARRGYSSEGSRHFLSVFFQLRRAYYFIARSLAGTSPCMLEFKRRLWNNVFTSDILWYERFLWDRLEDFSTLLLGETGTGKGAAAAAIGRSGYIPYDERRGSFEESFTRAFISINLSQYPAALIESELFGHRKGAFTGAIDHHEGVLARCSPNGAIFIDEIGDVGIPVQVKLLQVLQERVFSPVGSHDRVRFRGRVIAATNRPLDELRTRGDFRDDFFYRLCSDVIVVPPLRQRLAEEPGEMDVILGGLVERLVGEASPELTRRIRDVLERSPGPAYAWPGNVRELEQAARRVLLTGAYEGQAPAAASDERSSLIRAIDDGSLDADQLLAAYCRLLHRRLGTYEAVAQRTRLDRRTAKKYIVRTEEN
jgi:hypothetical protein